VLLRQRSVDLFYLWDGHLYFSAIHGILSQWILLQIHALQLGQTSERVDVRPIVDLVVIAPKLLQIGEMVDVLNFRQPIAGNVERR